MMVLDCRGKVIRAGYETTCEKRVMVFPGDIWKCLTCDTVHHIPDEIRDNGYQPVFIPNGKLGRFGGH